MASHALPRIDFYIDERNCNEASFEYFLREPFALKSVTIKSIQFYNSWWTKDLLPINLQHFGFWKQLFKETREKTLALFGPSGDDGTDLSINERTEALPYEFLAPIEKHISLAEFCSILNNYLDAARFNHVKIHCDESNYLTLELTEDKSFPLSSFYEEIISEEEETLPTVTNYNVRERTKVSTKTTAKYHFDLINKWFGFRQEIFTKKGKYYSAKPLKFYRSDLFLRANLTNQHNTFYNNKGSNIFCIIPVDDGAQTRLQRYEPNCKKEVNESTNHIKIEITDENEKVVHFRGAHVLIHLQFEIYPILDSPFHA